MENDLDGPDQPSRLSRAIILAASGVVRAGIRSGLLASSQFEIASGVADPEELAFALASLSADVVVATADDADFDELASQLERVPAAVVLAGTNEVQWLEVGQRLGAFALVEPSAALDEVLAAAVAVTAGFFVTRPRVLATKAMHAPPTEPSSASQQLTPREREVLVMMSEGLGNKTIAYRLGISEHTVKFHVGSILRKFDAESRTEAVTQGISLGHISV